MSEKRSISEVSTSSKIDLFSDIQRSSQTEIMLSDKIDKRVNHAHA